MMMFGLINLPDYFCKLISIVLRGLESYALLYIDDIGISDDRESYVKHLDIALKI